MSLRFAAAGVLVALTLAAGTVSVIGQTRSNAARPYTAPKTPWGEPDLQGI